MSVQIYSTNKKTFTHYRIIRCILGIIFYNDSHKIDRIKLIFLAVIHGLFCKKMGKSIDPDNATKIKRK